MTAHSYLLFVSASVALALAPGPDMAYVLTRSAHPALQILILGATVNMVCLPVNILLACFAASLTDTLRRNESFSKWLQRGMGALFIGFGLRLAVQKS